MTLIHLLRHGEVENPANLRYGRIIGFHLSRRGEEQAVQTARYLRDRGPIEYLVSSPVGRAIQTASIVQRELQLGEIAIEDRVTEAWSRFDGLSRIAFLSPRHWPKLWNPFEPSWAEPFDEVAARMRAAIYDVLASHRDQTSLVVTHQGPIWNARHALEREGPPWLSPVRCAHASLTTLRFDGDRYVGHSYWAPG
jgi:broad specificity phosphatase PhoE